MLPAQSRHAGVRQTKSKHAEVSGTYLRLAPEGEDPSAHQQVMADGSYSTALCLQHGAQSQEGPGPNTARGTESPGADVHQTYRNEDQHQLPNEI